MKLSTFTQISLFSSFIWYTCLAAPIAGKLYQTPQSSSKGQILFQVSPKINNQNYVAVDFTYKGDLSPYKFQPKYSAGYNAWAGGLDTSGLFLEGDARFPTISSTSMFQAAYQTNSKGIPESQIRCRFMNGEVKAGPVFAFREQVGVPPTANRIMCRAFELSTSNAAQQTPAEDQNDQTYNQIAEPVRANTPVDVSPTDSYNNNPNRVEEPSYSDIETSIFNTNPNDDNIFEVNPYSIPFDDSNDDSNDDSYNDPNDDINQNPYDDPFNNPFENSNDLNDDYSQY